MNLVAQKMSVIKGRIYTQNNAPAYVTVELKKQKKITETDNNGYFKLVNVQPIEDTLVITSAESQTKKIRVNPLPGETQDLGNIDLNFNVTQLQDIEVKGRTTHSYKSDYSFLGTKTESASIDIPQSISSITKELIKDKMSFTLKDAANEAAGVNNYSGYDDYSIRGFKAENARLINGLRGYNTTYTSAMLVNIERVEVVKGPSATLYGNCDPGGTINLVTKKPLPQQEAEINIGGGTWNHYRVTGDVTGPLNSNKTLLYRFNTGYNNTNSFRNQYFARSYELAPSLSFIPNDKLQLNIDFSLSHINTMLDRGRPGFQNDYSLQPTAVDLIASQPGDHLHETGYATNVLFSYKVNKHINFNSGYLNYITQQNVAEHGVQSYITPDSVNL
jgi:iron complex outermembrane recepter protein